MKSNQEVLDGIGSLIIKHVFDRNQEYIQQDLKLFKNSEYPNLFFKMNEIQKKELEKLVFEMTKDSLFDFLNIFEENDDYKLIYEEDGKQVNLVEISEMLKAEPIIENGWIARFSKYVKDDEII